MRSNPATTSDLTGSILIATPALKDPHFRKTILFLSCHSPKDGTLGFVLNRPLHKTVGEILSADSAGNGGVFAPIPLFYGGPVAQEEVSIASLRWIEQPAAVTFRAFSNLSESGDFLPEQLQGLRAFAGRSSWHRGQLEEEIAQKAWFVVHPNRNLIDMPHPDSAWKDTLGQMSPILKLLAGIPDDPSLN